MSRKDGKDVFLKEINKKGLHTLKSQDHSNSANAEAAAKTFRLVKRVSIRGI